LKSIWKEIVVAYFTYYLDIDLEGMTNPDVSVLIEIRTEKLPDTNPQLPLDWMYAVA
jgi:hypothetical protein